MLKFIKISGVLLIAFTSAFIVSQNSFSQKKSVFKGKQSAVIKKDKSPDLFSKKEKVSPHVRQPVIMKKDNSPLSQTPANIYSAEEKEILNQMNLIKRPENLSQEGDKILGLQKKLELTPVRVSGAFPGL